MTEPSPRSFSSYQAGQVIHQTHTRSSVMDGAIGLSSFSRPLSQYKYEPSVFSIPRSSLIRPRDKSSAELFGGSTASFSNLPRRQLKPKSISNEQTTPMVESFIRPKSSMKTKQRSYENILQITPRQTKLTQLQSAIFFEPEVENRLVSKKHTLTQEQIKPGSKVFVSSHRQNISTIDAKEMKRRTFNVPTDVVNHNQVGIENIEIVGLNPKEDDFSVKALCKGVHVIAVNTDINNITGQCTGKAFLSIREHSQYGHLDKLKLNLAQKGLTVKYPSSVRGRKNSYSSTRELLDREIKQPTDEEAFGSLKSQKSKRYMQSTIASSSKLNRK